MSEDMLKKVRAALSNIAFSSAMEGLPLTDAMEMMCIQIASGERSLSACLTELNAQYSA